MFLDTSILISALAGKRLHADALRRVLDLQEDIFLSSLVLFEWLRGPRLASEVALQEQFFPNALAVPFGLEEAKLAAQLYRTVRNPRGRDIDLGIAACAIIRDELLWTLNTRDFSDIPGLRLAQIR